MVIPKFAMLVLMLAVGIYFYFTMKNSLLIKALCSTAVFTYALSGAFGVSGNPVFRFLMAGGLLCCLIGDIVISFSFISGMAAFAAAHVCFITGFIMLGLFSPPGAPLGIFFILFITALYAILKLNMVKMELKTAACIYAALLTFMTSVAVCAPARCGLSTWSAALALGSVLFLASDTLLALMTTGKHSEVLDYISLPAYYLAISLFAQSVNCPI